MELQKVPISAFARHLGVSHPAVSKAVYSGALGAAVTWVRRGRKRVAEIELEAGVRAWLARPGSRAPALTSGKKSEQPAPPPAQAPPATSQVNLPAEDSWDLLRGARLRFEAARAKREELHLAEESGRVIQVEQALEVYGKQIAEVKTAVMALGKHARSRIPHLSVDDVTTIEALCREALQGLAAGAIQQPQSEGRDHS